MSRGMILGVARAVDLHSDTTLGGISSRFTNLTLVGILDETGDPRTARLRPLPVRMQVFGPADDRPPVLLQIRQIGGKVASIVPANEDGTPAEGWHMAGGNYAAWSDSRISDLVSELLGYRFYGALPIHDRKES